MTLQQRTNELFRDLLVGRAKTIVLERVHAGDITAILDIDSATTQARTDIADYLDKVSAELRK